MTSLWDSVYRAVMGCKSVVMLKGGQKKCEFEVCISPAGLH